MTGIEALQNEQRQVIEQIYDLFCDEVEQSDSRLVALNARYTKTVDGLIALLGRDAPCGAVDSDLCEVLNNVWKDEFGCRPSSTMSHAQALAYLEPKRRKP